MKTFLIDRTQFTELENRQSKVIESLKCSVVQGSKLSSTLYTIYTNEVPRVHLLMKDKEWMNNQF